MRAGSLDYGRVTRTGYIANKSSNRGVRHCAGYLKLDATSLPMGTGSDWPASDWEMLRIDNGNIESQLHRKAVIMFLSSKHEDAQIQHHNHASSTNNISLVHR